MKKIILLAILAIGLSFGANAQSPAFQKGDKVLNVGLGLNSWGIPIEGSMSFGVLDNTFGVNKLNLDLGGYLGFFSYHGTNIGLGVRSTLHYTFVKNLDTYAGLKLGFIISEYDYNSPLDLSLILGARYYFTNNWAGFLELGGGFFSGAQIGVAYKF